MEEVTSAMRPMHTVRFAPGVAVAAPVRLANTARGSIYAAPTTPRAHAGFFISGAGRRGQEKGKGGMAKKPGTNPKGEFAFFDVVYEDGSQRSNRRVPAELLGGLEKDEPARGFIIEQDREIAEKSGRAPLAIKTIARSGAKKK